MKKYQTINEMEATRTTEQLLETLRLLQFLLRNNVRLNDTCDQQGWEIADILQSCIDAIERTQR